MHFSHASPALRRPGLTLVELLVVLFIIAGLLALLLPAVQHARESAARVTCQNNLRQLTLAMRGFWEAHKRLPDRAPANCVGGWSVAILPFMEQQALADELMRTPSLDPGTLSAHARNRLPTMTCPSACDGESRVPSVPASHYVLTTGKRRDSYRLGDAPLGLREPWIVGPEAPPDYPAGLEGPHDGGFNIADSTSSVQYVRLRPR